MKHVRAMPCHPMLPARYLELDEAPSTTAVAQRNVGGRAVVDVLQLQRLARAPPKHLRVTSHDCVQSKLGVCKRKRVRSTSNRGRHRASLPVSGSVTRHLPSARC